MAIHLAKISPLLLVFGLALPLFAHAATINPPPNNLGLVGYWSFDEGNGSNATDFSGQGHTATLTGGTWVSGKLGNALSFNGTSDKVTGGSFTVGTNMTISAWVYKNTSTAQRSFFSNRGANGKVYFGLYGTQIFLFDNGGSPNSFKSNTGVVSIGKWQHIVVTSDGSTSTFYINGIFATSTTQTRTASTGASFGIGWDPSLLTEFWDGKIDEVRVYSRTLSAAEVSALYQTSAAKFNVLNNNGLVGYWNFNEGGGTTAGDHSGNGTLGTLTGTALPTWTSGKIGQSLTFNGSNQVSLRSMSALTTFTISAWVRLNATPHAYDMIFVTRDTGGGNGIDFRFEGGKLKLYSGGATSLVVTTGTYGPANGWMYVTATRDGAGNATIYINGVVVASGTLSAPNAAYFGIPLIGNYTAGRTDSGFQGQIDEVRVYNRALGASEIATLYQAQGAIAGASQSPGTLFSGLLGWWTFDGKDITTSFVDRSGNGFNGYLIGTNNATSSRETIGKLGQGFSFAGQNTGAINLGTSASLTPTNFTIAGWVYYSSTGYCYNYIYSNSRDVSGGNGIDFKIYCNGSLNGSIWNAGSSVAVGVSVQAYVGKWVHVAFTADGSFLRMYVNGALAATQAQTISPGTPSLATCIGSMGTGGCASFTLNGKLDDVRLYNRALSASEIKQLYNMGK